MTEGLLHALVLDGKGGAESVDWKEIEQWTPAQGTLWLHFDYEDAVGRAWLEEKSGLDELIIEALLSEETRPRANSIGDGMLVSLRGVNLNPGADPEDMVAIRIWTEADRIITTRQRRLLSVADIVGDLERARGPRNTGGVLVELAERLTSRMHDVIDDAEDRVAAMETRLLEGGGAELRSELADLRREVIELRRYLAPQREALARMQMEKVPWMSDRHKLNLREVNDTLIRYVEDLDSVRERAAVAQEELVSRLSDQLNQRMYVLSVIAAIFLPLGFLTGLLGINVGGIPGAENPWGFDVFLFILIVLVAVQMWVFRKNRWL